jgi:glycosyltransferase involved in cell wall biosynthesis
MPERLPERFPWLPLVPPQQPTGPPQPYAHPMRVAFVSADFGADEIGGVLLAGGATHYRCALPAHALNVHGGHQTVLSPDCATWDSSGALAPLLHVHRARCEGVTGVLYCPMCGRPLSPSQDVCDTCHMSPVDRVAVDRTGYEVIVLMRWMHQDAPDAIMRARAAGQKIVNDVDDWMEGMDPRNEGYAATAAAANPRANIEHYRKVLACSDAVTCSTPFLAKKMLRYCDDVTVIRNAIDLERWTPWRELYNPIDGGLADWRLHHLNYPPGRFLLADSRDRPLVYGWVGATPWRSGDLETIAARFARHLERTGAMFAHGGYLSAAPAGERRFDTPAGPVVRQVPARRTAAQLLGLSPESVAWEADLAPIGEYPTLFRGIDVGLVPLADVDFNEAKSCIKGMEYAASGIPFIAAATGEYEWFQGDGATCLLPRSGKEWAIAFDAMADPAVRQRFAARAAFRVRREDIRSRWVDWESCYQRLTG